MTKQQRIDELERENAALRRTVADYKARHDKAVSELADLAQGLGIKATWMPATIEWDQAMQNKAALAVAAIAKMSLREAP